MKKIIITGAPRTGTTALANLLNYSPKIVITNELGIFDHNQNHYKERSKTWIHSNKATQKFLGIKNLTGKDIDDFFAGNFENQGNLEFYGDKHPTYCIDKEYCTHLIKNCSDAYFIFTHRNPCATIYSGLYRSKAQPEQVHADWFFKSVEDSTSKIETFTINWSGYIYPNVNNKIIIDYDRYVNNYDLLIRDLSKFLNTSLDLPELKEMTAQTGPYNVGDTESRGMYNNSKLDGYKDEFTKEQIDYINKETNLVSLYVKSLITEQESLYK
jgi:hypothetical protein